MSNPQEWLRSLPSVSALLEMEAVQAWLDESPRFLVVNALQGAVSEHRKRILGGEAKAPASTGDLLESARRILARLALPSLRPVINATGIVLHTGLGRAPLSQAALDAIVKGAEGYCNLEFDLASGERGHRADHVAMWVNLLTGAEGSTVVNNNAAATLLILHTLAQGQEVIVSRGQLVEIGGSYRLPTIMSASGAMLREIGTTNRTRLADYEAAIDPLRTALILRVHPSNYRVVGFTEDVPLAELAALGRRRQIPVIDDLGSGAFLDLAEFGLPAEPLVHESIATGADLVCFSGDKLLGGPQCGIIAGKKELIRRLEANPLMRTYRVDKLVLLALEATLRTYLSADDPASEIPTLAMLTASDDHLAARARRLEEQLHSALPGEHFCLCSDVGFAGGGALPARELPTVVVQWRPHGTKADEAASALRRGDPPVVARIRDEAICFDVRTLRDHDLPELVAAIATSLGDRPRKRGETAAAS
jgi:L-seryl-tRNA(Ser) seleniumtransferase